MPYRHDRRRPGRLAAGLIVITLLAPIESASADKGTGGVTQHLPAAVPSVPEGVRVELGAEGVLLPRYEGSKRYDFTALPVIRFKPLAEAGGANVPGALGAFDVRALDDFSFAVVRHSGFSAGPLAGYRFGRDEKDSPRLNGLGDIDGGLVAGAFARYDFGREFVRASFHQRVTGTDTGFLVRLAAGTRVPVAAGVVLKANLLADLASDDYMAAYFGVTPAQSARSGLRAHDAGAGLKSVGGTLATEYKLSRDWTLLASVGYTRLLGDAASSPIVETADRYEARLGASRAVEWRWR